MTSEFIFQKLPDKLKSACVDLENLDPNTLQFVTGVEDSNWTCSGYKLKTTGQWHLMKREVSSDDYIIERMVNNGQACGIGRNFYPSGSVDTYFFKDGYLCGERIEYAADGSIWYREDCGGL